MQSKYLYAGTYSSLLINQLLTKNQRELLLATTSVADVRKVLQDTCFAPQLDAAKSLNVNLDDFALAQKKALQRIAPDEATLAILFLQYDYSNAKLIFKALAQKENADAILAKCSALGTIPVQKLYQAVASGTLHHLDEHIAEALKEASLTTTKSFATVLDEAYFAHVVSIAQPLHDTFISSYVALQIDFYNLQMRLREFVHTESEALHVAGDLVAGGTLTESDVATQESTLRQLERFGGKALWHEAITKFTEQHNFTDIDRATDNYLAQFLKQATIDPHSSSSLYAYFLSVLNHTQFVRSIIAAHNVGLSETELRSLVRNSIHDYAY